MVETIEEDWISIYKIVDGRIEIKMKETKYEYDGDVEMKFFTAQPYQIIMGAEKYGYIFRKKWFDEEKIMDIQIKRTEPDNEYVYLNYGYPYIISIFEIKQTEDKKIGIVILCEAETENKINVVSIVVGEKDYLKEIFDEEPNDLQLNSSQPDLWFFESDMSYCLYSALISIEI